MILKNTALVGFGIGHFINASTGAAVTTGTPTCKRTLDGTGGACANAASYNTDGAVWEIDLAAADLNGDMVILSFTLTDCLPISYTIRTVDALQTGDSYAVVAHADYGNAKLVRSTTPANTLSVDANNKVAVPDTQKVDLHTIKTQTVTAAAGVTFPASIGTSTLAAGAAMALTSGERTTLAAAIEAAIINEMDGTAVMQAIADLIASDMTTGDLTVQAIATATRDAVLDRVLAGNHDVASSVGKLLQYLDAAITSRHPSGAAVAKSPASLDWSADVTNKPTIGTSDYDGSDTAGTTTLLGRVLGTLDSGTHKPQSGDSYPAVSSGTHGNAALKAILDTSGVVLTAAQVSALVAVIEAEIADDATGEAVKQAIVDKLIENLPDLEDITLTAIADAVWAEATRTLTDKTGFALHATTGWGGAALPTQFEASNMRGTDNAALAATALSTTVWMNAKAGYLDENVSAAKTLTVAERTSIGTAVWASTTRTLTSFGTLVADTVTAMQAAGTYLARLFGLIENSDGDRFTAKALEQAAASSAPTADAIADEVYDSGRVFPAANLANAPTGATASVTVLPYTGTAAGTGELSNHALTAYQHAAATFALGVYDSAGVAVDLTGLDLAWIAFDPNRPAVAVLVLKNYDDETAIAISGESDNTALVSLSPADTALAKNLSWILRDVTNDLALMVGTLRIVHAPAVPVAEEE